MKIVISTFMVFIGSVLYAQNSKLESIFKQIPAPQDKFMCKTAEYYTEEMALFESLTNQLEKLRLQLDEEVKNKGDETYNILSAGFPTDEELKKVEKLSEAAQQAFWKKIEDDQAQIEKAVASNNLKYQAEKEALNKKVADYQNEILTFLEEISKIGSAADKVKSDKRQKIYNTYIENNRLSEYGQKKMEEICIEFCSTFSPVLLSRLRFEYDNLKQNMFLYRRLTVIELAEFSNLSEEAVCKQNAAVLDLNDLEMLTQFLNNYRYLFDIIPGAINNQY